MTQSSHKKLTYSQVQEIIVEHTKQIEKANAVSPDKESPKEQETAQPKHPKHLPHMISKIFKK